MAYTIRQIATGFSMTGTHQYTAALCPQRKDMSWLNNVGRLGITRNGDFDGARAVSC